VATGTGRYFDYRKQNDGK